ncbi:MAG: hypothetical protein AAF682_26125 [Planctomycetota bacterium]
MGSPELSALFSERVAEALADLGGRTDPLEVGRWLRKRLPVEEARAAAELVDLRRRARGRLPDAERLFLTPKGLEQATDGRVARARADRIAARLPGAWVWDATAGIGGDALALRGRGLRVVASDRDAASTLCARANLGLVAGSGEGQAPPPAVVLRADALEPPLRDLMGAVLLLDPDRRPGSGSGSGGRRGHPEDWSPPLSAALALAGRFAGACLKLPPALDVERIDPDAGAPAFPAAPADAARAEPPASWQWVSVAGELKEIARWTGALAAPGGQREVLALDARGQATVLEGVPERRAAVAPEQAELPAWISDPDPAVVRSGLLGLLADRLDARPLAPEIAYLASDERPPAGLVRPYRVLASTPLDRKRVRRMLAEHDVGPLTVKKRGHPDPAERLAARLRGKGSRRGLLLIARLERGHRAYLVTRSEAAEASR